MVKLAWVKALRAARPVGCLIQSSKSKIATAARIVTTTRTMIALNDSMLEA